MHIPKTRGGYYLNYSSRLHYKLAQSQADRYNPCKPQQPLCSFCDLDSASALMMSPLLPLCLRSSLVILKSLLIVGLWLSSFQSPCEIQSLQFACYVCMYVPHTFQWLTSVFLHACVNRVKSHPAIASTFLYMNNIIINYLWPNLFCYNFPVE